MDINRFSNLVLHICARSPEPPATIRLAKLLWLLDKTAYLKLGHKLTGCEYLRKRFGPVPRDNKDLLCLMRDEGLIELAQSRDEHIPMVTDHARKKADLSCFTYEEQGLINNILDTAILLTTGALVRQSHDLNWALTENNSVIPFESYLSEIPMDDEAEMRCQRLIEEAEYEYEEG